MHDDAPDQVRVRFEGARAGSGPLTFGQRNTLNWVRQETDEFSAVIHSVLDLPEGVTLADIGAAFAVLLARHESLRTSYTVDSDEPVQHVARAGELVIEVHRPADPVAAVSDVLVARLRAEGIDFTSGLPLRVAVAVHHDVPVVAVLVCSHMAVDFGSMAMVARQFTELAADPASRVLGEPGHQPLDQAAVEHSDRGRRSAEAALRYWETHLRSAPQSMYPVPPPAEPGDGLRRGFMLSPAGGLALGHITVRTRSSRQVVLLAAMCAVLSQRTGVRRCVFASVSGNRFRVRLREYVGALAQDGLLALDVEGPTFDDLVVRAARATLAANTNSMFDSSALWRIIDQVGHERGTAFTRDFSLNDLSTHLGTIDSTPGVVGDVSSVAAALAQTTVQWFDSVPYPVVLMCNPAQLEPALMFALTADTRYVGEAETESLLRGVEALLVAAASGTVSLDRLGEVTGVEPVHRGADWVCVDSCWVDLPAVSALVAEALPESTTHVVATNSPTGPGITAYLTATDDVRTPVQAHAACMATLIRPGRHTAMAPTHYSLHVSTPVDPAEDSAWQALPVLAEGDGRVKTS
jgi:Condensation domain